MSVSVVAIFSIGIEAAYRKWGEHEPAATTLCVCLYYVHCSLWPVARASSQHTVYAYHIPYCMSTRTDGRRCNRKRSLLCAVCTIQNATLV